jgi:hypothetical protein
MDGVEATITSADVAEMVREHLSPNRTDGPFVEWAMRNYGKTVGECDIPGDWEVQVRTDALLIKLWRRVGGPFAYTLLTGFGLEPGNVTVPKLEQLMELNDGLAERLALRAEVDRFLGDSDAMNKLVGLVRDYEISTLRTRAAREAIEKNCAHFAQFYLGRSVVSWARQLIKKEMDGARKREED